MRQALTYSSSDESAEGELENMDIIFSVGATLS